MDIKEAIGIRFGNIDTKTGERVHHREIYRRAIEYLGGLDAVLPYVPFSLEEIQTAIAYGDVHLNRLPLKKWDTATGFRRVYMDYTPTYDGITFLLQSKGINGYSCAENVCILKEAAREWAERGF